MRSLIVLAVLNFPALALAADTVVSDLRATPRGGQLLITWKEAETPAGTTFNVYRADKPITALDQATLVAHHIEPHSARDWWADPASFDAKQPAAKPVGYRVGDQGERLDPRDGLFVYTVAANDPAQLYFAVTTTGPDGVESRELTSGGNVSSAIDARPGPILAFWQHDTPEPAVGAGKDHAVWLRLHGKSGVVPNMEYLAFGDHTLGWRAGLPFKFSVKVDRDTVYINPTDRTWIGRVHGESTDNHAPAIWTFWYGYNSKIYDRAAMSSGVPTNYTERRLLWMLDFVGRHYQPDRNRYYLSGSSMGGCGTVSFGLRHPELFAALHAHVPIVSYTYEQPTSAHRLEPACWTGQMPASLLTDEGTPLLERMNGVRTVQAARGQLPFLFMLHGRNDGSIPWQNNPPFYRVLNDTHRAFVTYWDEGTHPTAGKEAPDDIKAWLERFRRFKLNESYPAFSNTSSNRNPGDGRATNGDPIGWMNRGFDWREIVDQPGRYEVTLSVDYPGIEYPVSTDVTLWRLQQFRAPANGKVRWSAGTARGDSVTIDERGGLHIGRLTFPSREPVRLVIEQP